MPKERSANPVQAQHKTEKRAALKKQKTAQQAQRNERLAKRNPARLQRQVDDLKALESSSGGQLKPRDKQTLEQLERDLRAVQRARESLGDKAPSFRPERDGGRDTRDGRGVKRQREDSDTDPDVKSIPMPRDTPPPIPRRVPNAEVERKRQQQVQAQQSTYSAQPQLRNLAIENKRFVPAAVAQNLARQKGTGGRLLEPEELDRLEKAGYGDAKAAADEGEKEAMYRMAAGEEVAGEQALLRKEEVEGLQEEGLDDARRIVEEMEKEAEFGIMAAGAATGKDAKARVVEQELRKVEMEEVEDEDL